MIDSVNLETHSKWKQKKTLDVAKDQRRAPLAARAATVMPGSSDSSGNEVNAVAATGEVVGAVAGCGSCQFFGKNSLVFGCISTNLSK